MQAILNIELDDKAGKFLSVSERFSAVLIRVRGFFSRTTGECREVTFADAESTSVAVLTVDFHTDKHLFEMALGTICRDFGQPCIAVFYGDGTGAMVGPDAASYEFDRAGFVKPAIFDLLVAA